MKVRITDKELEWFKTIHELSSVKKNNRGNDTEQTKLLANLISKCEKSKGDKGRPQSELTVREFLNMARLVLGHRLKEQLKPTPAWYRQMQTRIDNRGINKAMANVALETCRDTWAGEVWIDTLINSLDKLCVVTPRNQKKTNLGWLKQIEEEQSQCPDGCMIDHNI